MVVCPSAFWSMQGVHTFQIRFILTNQPTNQPTKGPAYSVVLLFQSWLVAALHPDKQLSAGVTSPGSATMNCGSSLRQCVLCACFHVLRRVAQFERSNSGNSWKWTRKFRLCLHWGRWCSCEPGCVALVCPCRSVLEQFTQSPLWPEKQRHDGRRRKREGAVHSVILEQLLGLAFSVLLERTTL